jgi:demethylmenaquinone methyltransferase/2-methoxy-6-polyprenyl-1,4-benzoquinol methylase
VRTGLWMRHLAGICRHVVALDSSPEVIEINRGRVGRDNVEFRLADLFVWAPDRQYDAVFFCFWLSHVPRAPVRRVLATGAAGAQAGRDGVFHR